MSKFDFNRINRDTPPADVNKIGKNFEAIEELALTEVDTDDIIDKAVTTEKIADGAITSDKISSDFKIGDMLKSVYDKDSNGIVDDSEKLGGQLPEYYAVKDKSVQHGIILSEGTDLNTIKTSGFYRLQLNHANVPILFDPRYCNMIVSRGSDTGFQFIVSYNMPYMAFRGFNVTTNVFTAWKISATTDNPSFTGNVTVEKSLSVPWIQQGVQSDIYVGSLSFTANVANEKSRIIFGKLGFSNWIEITLTGMWGYGNAIGKITKMINVSTSGTGNLQHQLTYYITAIQNTASYLAIGDFEWDVTDGWYVRISKLSTSFGGSIRVHIKSNGSTSLTSEIRLFPIYTTDTSVFDAPVPQIPINTVMRSGTVDYEIATIRKVGIDKSNVIFGEGAGVSITTGIKNTFNGYNTGKKTTSGSYNVLIGNNLDNILGEDSNYIRIGNPGDIRFCHIAGIYNETTASGVSVLINSSHKLGTTTSSLRYKKNIEGVQQKYVDAFFDGAIPIWYQSNTELCVNDDPDYGWWGFIAEELAEIDPRLVHFDYHEDDYEIVTKYRTVTRMIPNAEYQLIGYEDIYEDSDGNEGDIHDIRIPIGRRPIFPDVPQEIEEEYEEEYQEKVLKDGAVKSPRAVHYDRITVLLTKEVQRFRKKEKWKTTIRKSQNKRIKSLEAKEKAQDELIANLLERIEKLEFNKG